MKAMPGIIIVKPIEKEEQKLIITNIDQTRLLKGKVIEIGSELHTDFNAVIPTDQVKKDDTIYFLSYEGNYDNFIENNQKYYAVKIQDVRLVV